MILRFSIMFSYISRYAYYQWYIQDSYFRYYNTCIPFSAYTFRKWYILPGPSLFEYVWCFCTLHNISQYLDIDHHEPGYKTCGHGAADLSKYIVIFVDIFWVFHGSDLDAVVFNSLRPSDAYMCHKHSPSLFHIMACRLDGAKPLSEPMLQYCWLDSREQTSVTF